MRIHHLVAGLLNPVATPQLICHVLLCEHSEGLVLVDAGVSRADLVQQSRLGPSRLFLNFDTDPMNTAAGAVASLGFEARDVQHIVLTHMDLDHIGGVADFPSAMLHTTAAEWHAATVDTQLAERSRYRRIQWEGSAPARTYTGEGDPWQHGLSGHEVLPGITLIPMPGHTRGHAAVAGDG